MHIQEFSSVVLICPNMGEWHTCCMHVRPFLSVALIYSNTREWLTTWMHVQPFSSVILLKHLGVNSHPGWCSDILISGSDLLKCCRVNSHSGYGFSHSDLLKYRRATHILDVFPITWLVKFMSIIYNLTNSSFRIHLSNFNILHWRIPHTYCQYSISLSFMVIQQDIVLTFWTTCQFQMVKDKMWFHVVLFILSFHWHSLEFFFLANNYIQEITDTYKLCWTHL